MPTMMPGIFRASHDGREDRSRGIVPGKAGLQQLRFQKRKLQVASLGL